ncbi:MAG: TonB-dependent receptor [Saprospiraceae bacterium]|nr:TonB-dependent receptor [Lewinella sp.]
MKLLTNLIKHVVTSVTVLLLTTAAFAQIDVSGTVRDAGTDEPLIGVSVQVVGTAAGTITDVSGAFQLQVESEATELLFSYVGYQNQRVTIGSQRNFDIALATDAIGLEQVVVVGYGTQEKGELTGSVSSVKGSDVENLPVTGASQALQGRAAGVNVVRNGGAPGAGGSIRIRGTGTVNNAEPLIVIDGVPSDNINDINPNDIESIEVLKDASTSAIYGLRAANGVVIVTTKRGKFNEDIKISLNAYTGTSSPVKTIDVLDAPTLAMLKRERYTNDGIDGDPIWSDPQYQTQQTNWQEELLNNGVSQNVDLTLRGGGQKSAFAISGGYYKEGGMIKNSYFERYYLRVNSDHKLNNWLTFGENLQLTRQRGNFLNTNSAQTGILWSAIRFHPGLPVQYSDGSYSSSQISGEFGDINNPIYTADNTDSESTRHRLLGNVFAEIKILESLKFKANFALDGTIYDSDNFNIRITDQIRQNSLNSLNRSYSEDYSLLGEYFLTYENTIGDAHNVKLIGGFTAQSFVSEGFSASRTDFASEATTQRVLDAGRTIDGAGGSKTIVNLASWFTRLNYAYQGKYLLTATFRRDGTSRFAEANRWGNFPAFSAGWRVSREPWFGEGGVISFLKLNGGWGRLGNQNVAPFQYLALIAGNRRYNFGGEQVTGSSLSRIPNENISWETTEITDFGIDLGLFENKLLATFGYFIKDTKDMLLAPPTIGSIGRANIPDQNVGEVRNQGLEIELTYRNKIGDLGLSLSGNASFIQNEVTSLAGREFLASRTYGRPNQEVARTFEGQPIGTFYGWQTDGLYQTAGEIAADPNIVNDPRREQGLIQPGDVRFLDLNADGIIDDQDRTILGDPFPDMTYGLNLGLTFKNLDLNLFVLGVAGVEIFNADRMQGIDPTYPFNMYAETINRWNGPNSSNEIPRMTTKRDNLNHRASDLFVEKGDFLRLKNLSIGYTLPASVTDNIGIGNWRFYITGQNVLTLTGYSGIDPELGYVDGNLQANVDYAQYPQARTFIFGTTVTF